MLRQREAALDARVELLHGLLGLVHILTEHLHRLRDLVASSLYLLSLLAIVLGVAVGRDFERLDFGGQAVVLRLQLLVLAHELVHLLADPVGMAGGAPGFLAALLDECVAVQSSE